MVEQQLKKLQNISMNESGKNKDWEEILKKEQKQSNFYWKEISSIFAIIAIVVSLLLLPKESIRNQAANPYEPIQATYFSNMYSKVGEVEPKSNYYPFIQKFKGEALQSIEEKLKSSTWKQIEGNLEGDYVTYKFVFADGTSKILRNYINEPVEYLYEKESGYAYVLQAESFNETIKFEMMKMFGQTGESKQFIHLLLFIIPLVVLRFIRNHHYKKEKGIQKSPKKYINKLQVIVQVTMILFLTYLTVIIQNLHIGWWVIGLGLSSIIFRLLDDKSEHYKWRATNELFSNFIALSIVVTQFYYLF